MLNLDHCCDQFQLHCIYTGHLAMWFGYRAKSIWTSIEQQSSMLGGVVVRMLINVG